MTHQDKKPAAPRDLDDGIMVIEIGSDRSPTPSGRKLLEAFARHERRRTGKGAS